MKPVKHQRFLDEVDCFGGGETEIFKGVDGCKPTKRQVDSLATELDRHDSVELMERLSRLDVVDEGSIPIPWMYILGATKVI